MDEWHVGDPADWGDSVGVPDIPYMGYLNNDDDEEDDDFPVHEKTEAEILHDQAWDLRNEGRYDEALVLIERAIELDDKAFDNWNIKAIILEDKHRYGDAIICYDEALRLNPKSNVIKNNKAYSLAQLANLEKVSDRNWQRGLNRINEALKLVSDDQKKKEYLHIKGNILDSLNRPIDAMVCYLLASGMIDKVKEIEKQKEIISNAKEDLINITGHYYYKGIAPFKRGTVVDLVKEPDNTFDRDAIRIEIDGEKLGYVANNEDTLLEGLKSASDLKYTECTNAEVMFILIDRYVIAKII